MDEQARHTGGSPAGPAGPCGLRLASCAPWRRWRTPARLLVVRSAVHVPRQGSLRGWPWTLAAAALCVAALAASGRAQLLATGRFAVVPEDSRIELFVRDNVGGFRVRAREFEGTAVVRQTGERSFVADLELVVSSRSVTTHLALRDSQMHREQLLTEQFPTITFQGVVTTDSARVVGTFPATVHGRLTLRGVTRQVSAPVQVTPLPDGFRGRTEFDLRMSDYGMPVPRFLFFVAEDVARATVELRLRATGRP
ncbi:MAG: hypothetical protein C4304_02090 [candidate division GAL15 bacterium]